MYMTRLVPTYILVITVYNTEWVYLCSGSNSFHDIQYPLVWYARKGVHDRLCHFVCSDNNRWQTVPDYVFWLTVHRLCWLINCAQTVHFMCYGYTKCKRQAFSDSNSLQERENKLRENKWCSASNCLHDREFSFVFTFYIEVVTALEQPLNSCNFQNFKFNCIDTICRITDEQTNNYKGKYNMQANICYLLALMAMHTNIMY